MLDYVYNYTNTLAAKRNFARAGEERQPVLSSAVNQPVCSSTEAVAPIYTGCKPIAWSYPGK